jgi:hypothetical protein
MICKKWIAVICFQVFPLTNVSFWIRFEVSSKSQSTSVTTVEIARLFDINAIKLDQSSIDGGASSAGILIRWIIFGDLKSHKSSEWMRLDSHRLYW